MRSRRLAFVWFLATLGLGSWLALAITGTGSGPAAARRVFLPGQTTAGHHQIELACGRCHTPFGGVRQDVCLGCHAANLEAALDSHAPSLFNDPRNAADLDRLDVRECITCHTEHRPELTGPGGVTLPADFCYPCHDTVALDRPTHRELSVDTCAAAGCHNYHDNRALHADFLVEHGGTAIATSAGTLPPRGTWVSWEGLGSAPLTTADADGPAAPAADGDLVAAWAGSGHAAAGVACSHCHQAAGAAWIDQPSVPACAGCHELEAQGFLGGRHGMRLAVDLEPMSPAMARLPMKPDAAARTLGCSSCHHAHAVEVRSAAVDGCLACHDDEHSLAYRDSPHFRLWERELSGAGPAGSGVSCASCHLPREPRRIRGQRGRRRAAQPECEPATQREDAS